MRKDIGDNGRKPSKVEFTNIQQDVLRRDISFNALFYDINTKEIVDLVGGINDLKNKVIRTVGHLQDRYKEDKLRVLRTIRFAARFNSLISEEIDNALKQNIDLNQISNERIRDEFLKGIKSAKSIYYFLKLLQKYDIFKWVFPDLKINNRFIETKNYIVLIAYLLIGNNINKLKTVLFNSKYTNHEIEKIIFLVKFADFTSDDIYKFKKLEIKSRIKPEDIKLFINLYPILDDRLVNKFISFKLSVTGEEMIAKGFKKGPEIGEIIKQKEIENFKNYII